MKNKNKNRVQLTSWECVFCPHHHAICNINWMGLDSWKSFPFEENVWDLLSLDTIYCSFAMI